MDAAETLSLAQELHRLRVGQGDQKELRASLAEVAFLAHYGRTPKLKDYKKLGKSLRFHAKDRGGQSVRVIWRQDYPFRVYSHNLDADIYAFVRVQDTRTWNFDGWLPIQQVEEAPVWWWVENGERKDYAHEVERAWLRSIPEDFVFVETCTHDQYGMVWSYSYDAWECFGCGNYVLNTHDKFRILEIDDRDRHQAAS